MWWIKPDEMEGEHRGLNPGPPDPQASEALTPLDSVKRKWAQIQDFCKKARPSDRQENGRSETGSENCNTAANVSIARPFNVSDLSDEEIRERTTGNLCRCSVIPTSLMPWPWQHEGVERCFR